MWTEAHRARHEPRLKAVVAGCAVEAIARRLEDADPPRSGRATPVRRVVGAIAWHLRVGGPWRALPAGFPHWRTVYGWFRRRLELGLLDALLREVARRRRRAAGRRAGPSLGIVDTQAVECIAVRGPRGYDAAKGVVGRKRVALVDADGNVLAVAVVPASVQDRDTPEALDAGEACWAGPACGRASTTARSRPSDAASGRTGTACATASSPATRRPRASSSSRVAGWSSAASAGSRTGAASPRIGPAGSMSPPPASPWPASSPAARPCSTRCRSATLQAEGIQTGSKGNNQSGVACSSSRCERRPTGGNDGRGTDDPGRPDARSAAPARATRAE